MDTLPLAYGWVHQARRRLNESGMEDVPLAITAVSWHAMEKFDPWSFSRRVPEAADRQQNFIGAHACLANAARAARGFKDDPDWIHEDLDHILWFNAVQTLVDCPCNPASGCPNCPCPAGCNHLNPVRYWRVEVLCRGVPANTTDAPLRKAVEKISDWVWRSEQ